MKRILLIILLVHTCNALLAQVTAIPDPIFENFLESNGMGNGIANDQLVTTANIVNRTNLNVEDLNISDLTGIEDFTSLSALLASGNALQSLDLSNLTNLNFVTLHDNQLTTLDISNNANLGSLTAWNNGLTTINITGCVGLVELYLEDNLLTNLDLSLFPNLVNINVTNNALTSFNLKSGGNSRLGLNSSLLATGNPNLECITVDDVVYATETWMNVDTTTSFSTDCNATTYVPNDNFEDYLETHDADGNVVSLNDPTNMGNGIANDDYVKTIRIEDVTALNISSRNINDLTGIEGFTALETLSCFFNQLTTLDLTSNLNLIELQASNNSLAQLDVKNNIALQTLNVDNNTIDELDLSNNASLASVSVSGNDMIALDMKNGNNDNITMLLATSNPNLSCIKVDNATASNNLSGWNKDATTNYEENCNETYIPDANFEDYLETHDADGNTVSVGDLTSMGNGTANDGIVYTTRIKNVTNLSISNKGIVDLTGIEDFIALETLRCPFNNIVTLDLSNNLALTSLNAVTNNIQSLDVSNNTNLTNLTISSNDIQSLDVSSNSALTYIAVSNNQLTFLNVKNGNNGNFTGFLATQNPGLSCINVDDENASYLNDPANPIWIKDNGASYGQHCYETYVPDAIFENYLETNNIGNGIANDNYVLTSNISGIEELDVGDLNIADLTGIEDFIALETLSCFRNNLTELNLSSNTTLINLQCYNNQLTTLDLSTNTALEFLDANTNTITSLNVELNTALKDINLDSNDLIVLNLNTCVALEKLTVDSNNLEELSVVNGANGNIMSFSATENPNLNCINVDNPRADYLSLDSWNKDANASYSIDCNETYIPDANFENYLETNSMGNGIANDQYVITDNINTVGNLDIINLNIADLTGIGDFVGLTELKANGNLFTTIDVSNLSQLTTAFLHNGNLTALDVTANLLLEDLRVENNQLTEIDLTNNTALRILQINGNNLTSIDVTNNIELARIRTYANPITELDLSNNTLLTQVWANNSSQLTTLNIKNGNNGIITSFNVKNNPNLTCINVDNEAADYLNSNNWGKDDSASFGEHCYETYIPDANFENYLETHDAAGNEVLLNDPTSMGNGIVNDNYVLTDRISEVTILTLNDLGVTDLTGIETFSSLIELNATNNNLVTIDVSSNIHLEELLLGNNTGLATIDVSMLPSLKKLHCYNTGISALDISNNTALEILNVDSTSITTLDLSANSALTLVVCQNNQLTSLDLSNNPLLTSVFAADNAISTVTFGANTVLKTLSLSGNSLTTIDLSQLTGLESLFIFNNSITSINLISNPNLLTVSVESNALTELDVRNGANGQIVAFTAQNNPNLSCINVDNASNPDLNDWIIDTGIASFAEHCNETSVPDINFEGYLETHDATGNIVPLNHPSSMGNGIQNDGYVKTNRIVNVTNLDVSFFNIDDVTGIEAFTALESFNCYDNSITTLNLSANTALKNLICNHNLLTALDLSANVNLEIVQASQNNLTTIDFQQNTALKEIYLQGAGLRTLNLDPCVALEIVDVTINSLTELSIKNGNNESITQFSAGANPPLNCINVDDVTADYLSSENWNKDATASYSENCYETYIPDANFENYLETHDAAGNEVSLNDPTSMGNGIANDQYVLTDRISGVTSLNISQKNIADVTGVERFTQLETFMCFNNSITTLDVSANTALKTLLCYRNNLTTLNINGNTALITLVCYFNELTTIDISTNTNLEIIEAGNNELTTLDVNENIALKQIAVYNNNLTSLTVDACIVLERLNVEDNDLTELRVANGNNRAITDFNATGNPNLTCITVDDATHPDLNDWLINEDGSTSFGEHCNETQVPDANFENYLETHDANRNSVVIGDPTSMGNGIANDGYVRTQSIQSVTNLRVPRLGIADLTGIEGFTALTNLDCSRNLLTSLDVSQNVLLTDLICSRNQLTSLDVSQNVLLTDLFISDNEITSLDLSQNAMLKNVFVSENQLTSLDLSNNPLIEELDCSENLLTNLNVNQCTVLTDLICNENNLQTIDFTTNTGLVYFEANNNDFTNLDFSQNIDLDYFSVNNNLLTSLDLSENTNLKAFSVEDNQITSLDLSLNFNLEEIICRSNALTSLNLKNGNNTNIDLLFINNNPNLTCVLVDDAMHSFPFEVKDFQTMFNEVTCGIQVSPKVMLQGAALNPNIGEETLMRDDLRIAGIIPTTSPYGDGFRCNASVFNVTGADAIVDWVWVELRDATNNTLVIDTQSALLQRDGDVVAVDGVTAVGFNELPTADYYIVIKHRNHLGIITDSTITLSKAETTIDFTDANDLITYGSNAQTTFGMQTDMVGMWAGNANNDTIIQSLGINSDNPSVLTEVVTDSGNFFGFPTYVINGYNHKDLNMDSQTQALGVNSETPLILQNTTVHPGNFFGFSTYQIQEQLPENFNQ